jgi:hypothetical protein
VRVRERGKEEESDFASLMGHSGEGIRVTGQLEAVHVSVENRGGVRPGAAAVCGRQRRRLSAWRGWATERACPGR